MAKYDYNALYDLKNAFPKRVPNIASVEAADSSVSDIGIPNDDIENVDDAKEYWNGGDLMAIYGITPKILYYARYGNLNSFIP